MISTVKRWLFGSSDAAEKHPLSVMTPSTKRNFSIRYPAYGQDAPPELRPAPVTKKVLMITHNPLLPEQANQTVRQHFKWNSPSALARAYIEDVRWASYGYANYHIVEHQVVDSFPIKRDSFRYTSQSYIQAWQKRHFHDPDGVDYDRLVDEFRIVQRIDSGNIDEVWLFGHPYGGYYESIMGGPGAFWCNAPALTSTAHASRRFVIMGFNFERGVGEMLEDLGHRAESMLFEVTKNMPDDNLWRRFLRYDKTHPNQAECGNVHFAPNSDRDYDWGNPREVLSRCDNWYRYPDLSGLPRRVDCSEWGNGDIRLHHLWWFRHMPHIIGETDGIANTWWRYILDPNTV
ncbi:MAG: hypothetical protein H6670_12835 [Anaerolineaceae bacterium]|nr:hypothetical protein [Anaerolineaceae bacterium]